MLDAKLLIPPTTAAATVIFSVENGIELPITVNGLAGVEKVAVEIYTAAATWIAYKINGAAVEFSVDTNKLGFDIPGRYRLNKPITAGAAGVLQDSL